MKTTHHVSSSDVMVHRSSADVIDSPSDDPSSDRLHITTLVLTTARQLSNKLLWSVEEFNDLNNHGY